MKILVTGGCGFIGSHLVDVLLAGGHEVAILDNLSRGRFIWNAGGNRPELIQASILDRDATRNMFAKVRPEAVFHMAAHHYIPFCEKNPYEAFSTNVTGTLNVVDASLAAGSVRKFFLASTGDVYAPCGYAHRETDPPAPVYVYGETKLACEALLRRYKSSVGVGFDITLGRIFNAAGTRETNPHFLPEVVRQLESNVERLEVGNTWPVRDFVDVQSMAQAIHDITMRTQGIDLFNIGSGRAVTVQQALDILVEASGRKVKVVSVEARQRPNDRPYLCPAVDKITTALGYAPKSFDLAAAKAVWAAPVDMRRFYA